MFGTRLFPKKGWFVRSFDIDERRRSNQIARSLARFVLILITGTGCVVAPTICGWLNFDIKYRTVALSQSPLDVSCRSWCRVWCVSCVVCVVCGVCRVPCHVPVRVGTTAAACRPKLVASQWIDPTRLGWVVDGVTVPSLFCLVSVFRSAPLRSFLSINQSINQSSKQTE